MARVHGSTRNGCHSLSRNKTIVMVHLLSGFVFDCVEGRDEERAGSKSHLSGLRKTAQRRSAEEASRHRGDLVQARGGLLRGGVAVLSARRRNAPPGDPR